GWTRAHMDAAVTHGGGLSVAATATMTPTAIAQASSGGIFAGIDAARATAAVQSSSNPTVQASLGFQPVSVTGDIALASQLTGSATSTAEGLAFSGFFSAGRSIAQSTLAPDVETFVTGGLVMSTLGRISLNALFDATTLGGNAGPA